LGRGLGWVTHRGPCQPRTFCDSVLQRADDFPAKRTSQLTVHTAAPRREAPEQQPAAAAAPLARDRETCLQQKRQGSAAHCKPHDLLEVGVWPAPRLHSELQSCLSRSLVPGEVSVRFWKPELINREDRHRKVLLASATFVNDAPSFTVRDFRGLQISTSKKVTLERDRGSGR